MTGYIKLYRRFIDWEWYTDIPCHILFEHCLLKANYEPKKWRGQNIEVGQFITSIAHLAKETGLTVRQVRTALEKLKSTNELTSEGHSQYSIITIKNWDKYQANDKQNDKRMTNERQASDKRATTTKEREERKEYSSSSIENKNFENFSNQKLYGKYNNVCLTAEQYNRLLGICASQKLLDDLVDSLSENIETGEEQPYRAEFPNAHSIRLEKYYEWRRKHPPKQQKKEVDGWSL